MPETELYRHSPMFSVNEDCYEPKALVIDLVRQCTERCAHCVVAAAPNRRDRLSLDNVRKAIADAKANDFTSVSFYGGEPFVAKQDLFESVRVVYEHGLQPQIMTNGYWGHTLDSARDMFARLHALRPDSNAPPISINVSTDEFHTKVPHAAIGNLIAAWAHSPPGVDVNLAIGNSGDSEYVLRTYNAILDAADAQLRDSDMRTGDFRNPTSGESGIAIIDKCLTLKTDLSPAEYLDLFEREDMLPPVALAALRHANPKSFTELFLLLQHNSLLSLVQTHEQRANGECQVGRFREGKVIQYRGYTINLFGAGRELQGDAGLRARIAKARGISDIRVNVHEYLSLLMLGNDNLFYASPIHLQHRRRPLGENSGAAIADVIRKVNDGETLSGILRNLDVDVAKMFLRVSGDDEAIDAFDQLVSEGLDHEALEVLLLSEKGMAQLPETWTPYRSRSRK